MDFPMGGAAATAGLVAELLEYAASDDVYSFIFSASRDPAAVHTAGFWYGRCGFSARMGILRRTPLMVAAAFASLKVLQLILSLTAADDVNLHWGADSFTALHCAASGGATAAHLAVDILLDAGADLDAVDAAGRRPIDLIPTAPILSSLRSSLEGLLGIVSPPLSPSSSSSSSSLKKEKRIYPIDPSIPDIQSSFYSSDEFRMFTFKVKPCSRPYSHDWTECPFLHPGENARRRDPRRFHYGCTPCADFRRGLCPNGDLCKHAHGVFECWLHPAQYRTRLCKDGPACSRRVCFFAHSTNDLRSLPLSLLQLQARASLPPPPGMSPSSSRRRPYPAERERLHVQFQMQQIGGAFGWSSQGEQACDEPDLSWIQALVGKSEVGNGGRLTGEAPSSSIDAEHAILKAWLEQMRFDDNKPAF